MELPSLGTNCAWEECNQLDFLPFTCDMCNKVFCLDHRSYDQHQCPSAYQKDVRVPTCPLCNALVPVARGEDPNIKMNEHIANQCQGSNTGTSNTGTAKQDPSKRCHMKGCKRVDMVQVRCDQCAHQFCLRHRGPPDHKCEGKQSTLANAASRRAATNTGSKTSGSSSRGSTQPRLSQKTADSRAPQQSYLNETGRQLEAARRERQTQATVRAQAPATQSHASAPNALQMSEDEALARALQESIQPTVRQADPPVTAAAAASTGTPAVQSEEDAALARAIAASLEEQERPKEQSSCLLS
eukprot:scpid89746/ scgid4155/ AN1-type zinc finger protein 2B; Arsenite-inducible RNA-associated protein-like protein